MKKTAKNMLAISAFIYGFCNYSYGYFGLEAEFYSRSGSKDGYKAEESILVPISKFGDGMFLLDVREGFFDDESKFISTGLGFRGKIGGSVIGFHGFHDYLQSSFGHKFYQIALGAESLSERFEARSNFYLPRRQTEYGKRDAANEFLKGGLPKITIDDGGNLHVKGLQTGFVNSEAALKGMDSEIGLKLANTGFTVYAGGYNFTRDNQKRMIGPRVRAKYSKKITNFLDLDIHGHVQEDKVNKRQVGLTVNLSFPIGGIDKVASPLMMQKIERRAGLLLVGSSEYLGQSDLDKIDSSLEIVTEVVYADGQGAWNSLDIEKAEDKKYLSSPYRSSGAVDVINAAGEGALIMLNGIDEGIISNGTIVMKPMQKIQSVTEKIIIDAKIDDKLTKVELLMPEGVRGKLVSGSNFATGDPLILMANDSVLTGIDLVGNNLAGSTSDMNAVVKLENLQNATIENVKIIDNKNYVYAIKAQDVTNSRIVNNQIEASGTTNSGGIISNLSFNQNKILNNTINVVGTDSYAIATYLAEEKTANQNNIAGNVINTNGQQSTAILYNLEGKNSKVINNIIDSNIIDTKGEQSTGIKYIIIEDGSANIKENLISNNQINTESAGSHAIYYRSEDVDASLSTENNKIEKNTINTKGDQAKGIFYDLEKIRSLSMDNDEFLDNKITTAGQYSSAIDTLFKEQQEGSIFRNENKFSRNQIKTSGENSSGIVTTAENTQNVLIFNDVIEGNIVETEGPSAHGVFYKNLSNSSTIVDTLINDNVITTNGNQSTAVLYTLEGQSNYKNNTLHNNQIDTKGESAIGINYILKGDVDKIENNTISNNKINTESAGSHAIYYNSEDATGNLFITENKIEKNTVNTKGDQAKGLFYNLENDKNFSVTGNEFLDNTITTIGQNSSAIEKALNPEANSEFNLNLFNNNEIHTSGSNSSGIITKTENATKRVKMDGNKLENNTITTVESDAHGIVYNFDNNEASELTNTSIRDNVISTSGNKSTAIFYKINGDSSKIQFNNTSNNTLATEGDEAHGIFYSSQDFSGSWSLENNTVSQNTIDSLGQESRGIYFLMDGDSGSEFNRNLIDSNTIKSTKSGIYYMLKDEMNVNENITSNNDIESKEDGISLKLKRGAWEENSNSALNNRFEVNAISSEKYGIHLGSDYSLTSGTKIIGNNINVKNLTPGASDFNGAGILYSYEDKDSNWVNDAIKGNSVNSEGDGVHGIYIEGTSSPISFVNFQIETNTVITNGEASHAIAYNDPGRNIYTALLNSTIKGNQIITKGSNSDGINLYRDGPVTSADDSGSLEYSGITNNAISENNIIIEKNGININLNNVRDIKLNNNQLNNNSEQSYKVKIEGGSVNNEVPLSTFVADSTGNTHQGAASVCDGGARSGSVEFTDGSQC